MDDERGIVLLSGGIDSVTLLHDLKPQLAISFNYNSKHNTKELYFAKKHCKDLNIEHIIVDIPFINEYFSSSLLQSGTKIPEGYYKDKKMKGTIVPFRNGILLSIAVGIADSRKLNYAAIGNHRGDAFIYPDCRKEFIDAFCKSSSLGTLNNIKIYSPYLFVDKKDIIDIGLLLDIDYGNDTWTCYRGNELHCGVCAACVERKEALGKNDNTIYTNNNYSLKEKNNVK